MLLMTQAKSNLVCIAVITASVLITHHQSLGNGFHYDDGHGIVRNPHIRSLANLTTFFSNPCTFSENPSYAMYRPLVVGAHAVNYSLGGYSPSGYLAFNLGIHCLVAALVFILLLQFGVPQSISLLGGLFFGLHPVQTEAINFVSARSESMAALFYLASLTCYLQATRSLEYRRIWQGASLSLFSLSLLSKEIAVTLPLALLLCDSIRSRRQRNNESLRPSGEILKTLKPHLPYWALLAAYFILHQSITGIISDSPSAQLRTVSSQLATQSKALVHYLSLSFMPAKLSVSQQFFESRSLTDFVPFVGMGVAASLLFLAFHLRRLVTHFSLGTGWFFLILAPTSLIPLNVLVNDHRPYLALLGLTLVLAFCAASMPRRWPIYIVIPLLGLLSYQRDPQWKDEITLWADASRKGPLMPEAHFNLGFAHHQLGNLDSALSAYEHAVGLDPNYVRAQTNLGAALRQMGRLEEAARALGLALQVDPGAAETLNNLGLTYAAMGNYEGAIRLYERALETNAGRAELWLNLGLAQRDSGLREEAFWSLSRAIEIDPQVKGLHKPGTRLQEVAPEGH